MVNRLIQAMIAIVIGLALLPVITTFVETLTQEADATADPPIEAGVLYDTAAGTMVELLPVLYVIILVAGIVGFIYTARK